MVRVSVHRGSEDRRKAWADYTAGWTRLRKAELAVLPLAVFATIGVTGFAIRLLFDGRLLAGGVVLVAVFALYRTLFRRMRRFPPP
jgi:hypothetical protein